MYLDLACLKVGRISQDILMLSSCYPANVPLLTSCDIKFFTQFHSNYVSDPFKSGGFMGIVKILD